MKLENFKQTEASLENYAKKPFCRKQKNIAYRKRITKKNLFPSPAMRDARPSLFHDWRRGPWSGGRVPLKLRWAPPPSSTLHEISFHLPCFVSITDNLLLFWFFLQLFISIVITSISYNASNNTPIIHTPNPTFLSYFNNQPTKTHESTINFSSIQNISIKTLTIWDEESNPLPQKLGWFLMITQTQPCSSLALLLKPSLCF